MTIKATAPGISVALIVVATAGYLAFALDVAYKRGYRDGETAAYTRVLNRLDAAIAKYGVNTNITNP